MAQAFLDGLAPGTISVMWNSSSWLETSVMSGSEKALIRSSKHKVSVLLLPYNFFLSSCQCVSLVLLYNICHSSTLATGRHIVRHGEKAAEQIVIYNITSEKKLES
jgi:hypothetical protein